MTLFERSWKSVFGSKGKSCILLLLLGVIGTIILSMFIIKNAVAINSNKIKYSIGSTVTVEYQGKIDEKSSNAVNNDVIEKIANYPEVDSTSVELKFPVTLGTQLSSATDEIKYSLIGQTNEIQNMESMESIVLVEGKNITADDIKLESEVIVISQELAELNNLSINDIFEVQLIVYESGAFTPMLSSKIDYSETKELKIIGIYMSTAKTNEATFVDKEEKLYVPYHIPKLFYEKWAEVFEKTEGESNEMIAYNTTIKYNVRSVDDVESFLRKIDRFFDNGYRITSNEDLFKKFAAPLLTMEQLANQIIIGTTICAMLIIGLVLLFFLNDRKHELGIYIALGELKFKIIAQVTLELLLIALCACTISIVSSGQIAKTISKVMVTQQMTSQPLKIEDNNITITSIKNMNELNLSFALISQFYLYSLGTVILIILGPMCYIICMKPKNILLNTRE